MDYRKVAVPFLNGLTIKKQADLFREKFWNKSIQVEIENIIDLRLKLDVIPVNGLLKLCDTDALITSNWKSIYVDYEKYLDDRYKNRLRFSLAHEIGHFILHKDIYNSFYIKNLEDFYRLIEQIPQEQYGYLESQANKFANHLLVPRNKLIKEENKVIKAIKENNLNDLKKIDDKTLKSYLAIPISKIFGVSEEVIEIAFSDIDIEA